MCYVGIVCLEQKWLWLRKWLLSERSSMRSKFGEVWH